LSSQGQEHSDAQLGYSTAIALMTYEGGLIWSKFNALLVANSVVVLGITAGAGHLRVLESRLLPAGGFVLCVLWFGLTKRAFDNYVYWILTARELEERHLAPTVTTLSRGGALAGGQTVTRNVGGRPKPIQISKPGRALTAAWNSYLVIAVFAALYLAILIRG
jgi:hypothetical protein